MDFKSMYPALNNCTYLDTASSGIISIKTSEWRKNHDESFLSSGSFFRLNQAEFLNGVRETVANFFNAKRDYCFLIPNLSFGFNTFLQGLDKNSKILLVNGDYPSVNYAIAARNFETENIDLSEDFEQKLFAKIGDTKPDVFAFSLVQYVSGYKIDLNTIRELKAQFPSLIIAADGTQYCGTENFNFKNSGIDFLASSGYKWMLGGYGNGFLLLSEYAADAIYKNAKTLARPIEPFLEGKSTLSTFFEPGHLDTFSFGSLQQAIVERKEIGENYTNSKMRELGQIAKNEFYSRGILNGRIDEFGTKQNIFNLKLNSETMIALREHNLRFTKRGDGARVAFHFYNDQEDIDHLLSLIDDTI